MRRTILFFCVFLLATTCLQGQWRTAYNIRSGAALPTACNALNGEVFYMTSTLVAATPRGVYQCTAGNTWVRLVPNNTPFFNIVSPAAGVVAAPFSVTVTGFEDAATFTRTDAGHTHILITSTLNALDLGVGVAGAVHIESEGAFGIQMRTSALARWTFNDNSTLESAGINFAALGAIGAPVNGMIVYCSDCGIANPCAGAGTGAFAKRLNGVWVCN